jgi:4-hydroxybenzoate polyprenyltransferase
MKIFAMGKIGNVWGVLRDILEWVRFKDWWCHLGFIYLGVVYRSSALIVWEWRDLFAYAIGALYLASGYTYNRICDQADINARIIHMMIIVFGCVVIGAYFISPIIALLVGIALTGNFFYTYPTIFLKKYHLFSVILNGYLFSILFLFSAGHQACPLSINSVLLALCWMIVMAFYEVVHEIAHGEEDSQVKKRRDLRCYHVELIALIIILILICFILYNMVVVNALFVMVTGVFILAVCGCIMTLFRSGGLMKGQAQIIRRRLHNIGILYGIGLIFSFIH